MKVIWKYRLSDEVIHVPKNSKILSIQLQDNAPQIWILVDENEMEFEKRQFITIATGQPFHLENVNYISTYQDGSYVWHIFENLKI